MNNNHHSGNGFMSGLFWGLIIGAGLALLFSTKKGRKILKALTENGFEGIAELEDLIEDVTEESDYQEPVVSRKAKRVSVEKEENIPVSEEPSGNGQASTSTISKIKSTGKRFFRGVPRRN